MAKKYVYIDGVRYEVVNNYILGLDVYSDGSIPTPTASDDGKVITVDENGNYVLGEGGGSGGAVVVNITNNAGVYEPDKTLSEIKELLSAGTVVMGKLVIDSYECIGYFTRYGSHVAALLQGDTFPYYYIFQDDGDGWTCSLITLTYSYPD